MRVLHPAMQEIRQSEYDFNEDAYRALRRQIVKALISAGFNEHLGQPHARSGFAVVPRENGIIAGVYYRHMIHLEHKQYTVLRDEKLGLYRDALEDAGFDVEVIEPTLIDGDPGLRIELFD